MRFGDAQMAGPCMSEDSSQLSQVVMNDDGISLKSGASGEHGYGEQRGMRYGFITWNMLET